MSDSTRVRVIRKVKIGYMLQRVYPQTFQFVKKSLLTKLGGPSSDLMVGDEFYLPSSAKDGINWQEPEIRGVNILNVGNKDNWGENVILRDLDVVDDTLQLSSGHIINCDCVASYDIPVSKWSYDPDEKYRIAVTPFGWDRAQSYSDSSGSSSNKPEPDNNDGNGGNDDDGGTPDLSFLEEAVKDSKKNKGDYQS